MTQKQTESCDVVGAMKRRGMYTTQKESLTQESGKFVSIESIEKKYGVRFTMPKFDFMKKSPKID